MKSGLKPFWNRFFQLDWKLGIFLLLVICIPRFIVVLHANTTGNYQFLSVIMVISALLPFIFLTKSGLNRIGITKPTNYYGLLYGFLIGVVSSFFLYFLADFLYENTVGNWYHYIEKTYQIPTGITTEEKRIYFFIFAATGMLFSPIGEELFFRGIVHSSLAASWGDTKASRMDSLAFALTHLSHFGLIYVLGEWKFLLIPAILWISSMYFLSRIFFYVKNYSGSILGAIVCHSGFNLGMTYSIFYFYNLSTAGALPNRLVVHT